MTFDEDCSSSDARDEFIGFLVKNPRKFSVQELIDLGETQRDKGFISLALSSLATMGALKVDGEKRAFVQNRNGAKT